MNVFEPKLPAHKQKPAPATSQQRTDGYAPFLSTVPRIPERKVKSLSQNQGPGPGSYDISKPLVRPIIETLRKSNNNIIIKINEVGSAAFKGDLDRFKQPRGKDTPGPGQYYTIDQPSNQPRRSVHYSLHNYRSKFQDIFNHQRTETIPQLKTLSRAQRQMQTIETTAVSRLRNEKGSGWSKYAEQRFKSLSRVPQIPGPGAYSQHKKESKSPQQRIHPSSSFVSQSVRSYFDKICFETNQDSKAQIRERLNYKSDLPGPGSYQIQTISKKPEHKFQFFGSTEERLLPEPEKDPSKEQKKPSYRRSPILQRLAAKMMENTDSRNDISVDMKSRNNSLSMSIETPSSLSLVHQKQRIRKKIGSVKSQNKNRSEQKPQKNIKMIFDQSEIF